MHARSARSGWARAALFLVACCAELIGDGLPLVRARAVAKPNLKLAWHAPSECTSERSAQRKLRGLIGEPSAQAPGAAVSVEISRRGDGYLAQIAFSGALLGTRELTGPRCDTLCDAALVIVAITAAPQAGATRRSSREALLMQSAAQVSATDCQFRSAIYWRAKSRCSTVPGLRWSAATTRARSKSSTHTPRSSPPVC